ncbi:MAG: hypothetical protein PHQ00_07350, partial [Phycisphaerae bacterium]|nr:hypothetical protein [Phycisphaerae bacterium]
LAAEIELDIRRPDILQAIGVMMMELEQIDYATHCFLRVSELSSADAMNYFYLGKSLALRGEIDDAEQFLDYAIELDAANYELFRDVLLVYLKTKRPQKVLDLMAVINAEGSGTIELNIIRAMAQLKIICRRFGLRKILGK